MIKVRYSKKEKDFVVNFKNDYQSNAHWFLDYLTDKDFIQELQSRGYDTDTFSFSILKLNEKKRRAYSSSNE